MCAQQQRALKALGNWPLRHFVYGGISLPYIGDDGNGNGIIFPQVTICNYEFTIHNPILSKCRNGSKHFLTAISNCLKTNPDFKINDNFMQTFETEHKTYIKGVSLHYGTTVKIPLDHLDGIIWSNVYHRRFGLCYQLDLEKSHKYKVSHNQSSLFVH